MLLTPTQAAQQPNCPFTSSQIGFLFSCKLLSGRTYVKKGKIRTLINSDSLNRLIDYYNEVKKYYLNVKHEWV